jgi:hypothetical protein
MPERFLGKKIDVVTKGGDYEAKIPASFKFDGREYIITEVLETWPDFGFAPGETSKTWRTRRHRSYYRVKTAEGEIYEIYFDRGTSLKHPEYRNWYVTQKL